jgi:hypothetical protein
LDHFNILPLDFEKKIYIGIGKACITAEEMEDVAASITSNNRLQNTLPVIGTMNIAVAKERSIHVAVLIEAEKGMIKDGLNWLEWFP